MQDGDTEDNTALLSSSPIQEQMDDFENNEDLDPNKEPEQEESVTPNHVQTDANEPIINEYLADEASLQPPAIDKEEGEDDEEDEEDEDEENEEHKEVTANDREEHAGSQEPEEPVINEEDTSIKQKEPMTDEEETPTATNQDSVITNDETGNDGEDKKEEYKFAIDTKANEVEAIDNSSIKTNDESPSTSKPIDTKNKDIEDEETAQNNRRSSVVATAAQSILGDKLDDFTEKLAFIKKNIIMSVDSDEEYDDEDNNVIATKKENIR
jgi:hypothetical protein